jgi:hypothetical protein
MAIHTAIPEVEGKCLTDFLYPETGTERIASKYSGSVPINIECLIRLMMSR